MADPLPAARLILLMVAASYPLAAGLLWAMAARGEKVPWYWPTGWLGLGLAGLTCAFLLAPGRPWAWWGVLVTLAPWMIVALVQDVRSALWPIALLDLAGLAAIAYALWMIRHLVF